MTQYFREPKKFTSPNWLNYIVHDTDDKYETHTISIIGAMSTLYVNVLGKFLSVEKKSTIFFFSVIITETFLLKRKNIEKICFVRLSFTLDTV